MAFSWDDVDEYAKVLDQYLPDIGEGDTMASQVATAVSRIGYRWFNDGDTIWTDECQSCADWLYENIRGADRVISALNKQPFAGEPSLDDDIDNDDGRYSDIYGDKLKKLFDISVNLDLKGLNEEPAVGSVFDCEGPVLAKMKEYQDYYGPFDNFWNEENW